MEESGRGERKGEREREREVGKIRKTSWREERKHRRDILARGEKQSGGEWKGERE